MWIGTGWLGDEMELTTENTEKSGEKQRVTSVLEWKKPSEAKPETMGEYYRAWVLAIVERVETVVQVELVYYLNHRWFGFDDRLIYGDRIIAWAELPESPKELRGEKHGNHK